MKRMNRWNSDATVLEKMMTICSISSTAPAALAFVIVMGTGGLHAQGMTDYKPGEGGGPIVNGERNPRIFED
jgi:hypothetical protein